MEACKIGGDGVLHLKPSNDPCLMTGKDLSRLTGTLISTNGKRMMLCDQAVKRNSRTDEWWTAE
tara:strand:- start:11608 stop:11799 length:192 start_codon:yes stop_codon:yes gene_type:complete